MIFQKTNLFGSCGFFADQEKSWIEKGRPNPGHIQNELINNHGIDFAKLQENIFTPVTQTETGE